MRFKLPAFGIRIRLVMLFLLFSGSTLIGFSYFLFQSVVQNHQREFDVALLNHTVDLAYSLDIDLFGGVALRRDLLQKEKVFPFSLGQTVVEVWTISGKPVARSSSLGRGHLPISEEELLELPERKHLFRTLKPKEASDRGLGHQNYRMVTYFIEKPAQLDFALQVAAPMVLLEQEQGALRTFLLGSIPLVLLLAAVGAYIVSRRAMAPILAMIEKSRAIGASDLSARVPVPRAHDELRRLAETLNALLSRLEGAFKVQEAFLGDASHQLKTPLAILRGELDLMRSQKRSPQEIADFLESSSQEVNFLARVVDDLLLLARIQAGKDHLRFEKMRVDEALLDVCSRLGPVAEAKRIQLLMQLGDSGSNFQVSGDPDLIRVLVENLLGNALKYSPEGTVITLGLRDIPATRTTSAAVEIAVTDEGPGIPVADQERVFERFYRGIQPRLGGKGHGLGLSIAKKIVDVHGGRISVENRQVKEGRTGSIFVVSLPAAS